MTSNITAQVGIKRLKPNRPPGLGPEHKKGDSRPLLTLGEKQKRNIEKCRIRRRQTVFIGGEVERWKMLQSTLGLLNDEEVARYLMDCFYGKISGFLSNSPIQLPIPDENVWSRRQKEQSIVNLQTQVDDRQACSETESISNTKSASDNEESDTVACRNVELIYDRRENIDNLLYLEHNYSLLANPYIGTYNIALETVQVPLLQPRHHNTNPDVVPCNTNSAHSVSKGDGNSVDISKDSGDDEIFSETASQTGVNGSPEPVQLQHGNIFLETEFDSGSESVKDIDDAENGGDFLKAHSKPGIEGPSKNVNCETKIDSCSEDMNIPETELYDKDEEISSDEDEFDISDVSDDSDDSSAVQQLVISENDAPRRSSRSCVQKAKKKIKRLAKKLRDKNEQRVDEIESEILENEKKKVSEMNSEIAKEKNFVDRLLEIKHENKSQNYDSDEDYVPSDDSYDRTEKWDKKIPEPVKFEKLDDGRFECNSCEEVFTTDENKEEHCEKHHKVFKCHVCEEHFPTKTLLETHRDEECYMEDTFQCEFCSFSCDVEQKFLFHLSKKHKKDKKLTSAEFVKRDNGTYQCSFCEDIFDSDKIENEHCSKHFGFFKCPVCAELFSTGIGLKRHQINKCSDKHSPGTNKTFQCKFCSFSCAVKRPFVNHMIKKHNDESYSDKKTSSLCDVCGMSFACKTTLTSHLCTAKPRTWLCSVCGEQIVFRRYYDKRQHLLTHSEKNVKCCMEGCNKVFHSQHFMLTHYRTAHSSRNDFICTFEQCGKKFSKSIKLDAHINNVHLKCKALTCDWPDCGKSFYNSWHLKVHTRVHKGETPIECKFCDYKCRQRASLKWHLRKHGIFNREEEMAALEKIEQA